MNLKIGCDILEIDRISTAIKKNPNFIKKICTKNEIEYANSFSKKIKNANSNSVHLLLSKETIKIYSAFFSAKEAISKSFGTGIRGFKFTNLEVNININEQSDNILDFNIYSVFFVYNNTLTKISKFQNFKTNYKKLDIKLDIAFSEHYVTAVALMLGEFDGYIGNKA